VCEYFISGIKAQTATQEKDPDKDPSYYRKADWQLKMEPTKEGLRTLCTIMA
jgi:hypothetical protein